MISSLAVKTRSPGRLRRLKESAFSNPCKEGSYAVCSTSDLRRVRSKPIVLKMFCNCLLCDGFILASLMMVWRGRVEVETENRVRLSQAPNHVPQSPDKALGPWQDQQSSIGKFSNQNDLVDNHWTNLLKTTGRMMNSMTILGMATIMRILRECRGWDLLSESWMVASFSAG